MISIKFSKRKEGSKVLKDSSLRDESTRDEEEERDFVTSVEGKEIQGTKKKEVKKELVIPLITKNEWRMDMDKRAQDAADKANTKTVMEKPTLSLEEQAVQELLGLSKRSEDAPENIPLLLQNQIPEGYEEEENMDVSLRPDQPTLEDYEKIPIEEFGMAMLRGMGWSKAEGIGLKNKQHVEILEPQLRPKGLGLGASVSSQAKKDVQNSSGGNKGKDDEEELVFKIGAGVVIQRGLDKGMYGKIEAFDEDNNRVVIKLAISGKMSTVSKFHMNLVKESDYKEKSKVLNYDQYEEYKEKQDVRDKDRRSHQAAEREREAADKGNKKSKHDQNGKPSGSSSDKKYSSKRDNHRSSKSSNSNSQSSKSSSNSNWVRSHLKVRFIDKKYKNGKHYEKKFVVEDVVALDRFVLRSESGGTFLEDIKTSQLETVIPKETGSSVCILGGRQKGKIGELVERNRSTETAIVKIPDCGVFEFGYDEICEFVGDPEDYY